MSFRPDLRVCLLTYDTTDLTSPHPEDDVRADPTPFLPRARWDVVELEKSTSVASIIRLTRDPHDLYFNFCDGAWDSDSPGIEVVQALERLDVPFTGATSAFYEPTREAMKRVCAAWGIDSPAYVIATEQRDVERASDTLRFPLIVKHPSSYSSIGLTRESRVETAAALRDQAGRMIHHYAGALIEEFIEGGEATVLVAETPCDPANPRTYTPIRYRFPEGETFKHYDLKWRDYHGLRAEPVDDPALEATLREMSAQMFQGLDGAGFGRCDLRIDRDGRPYMLEINPNCGLYYPPSDPGSADLCLLHDPAGHEGFTRQIVDAAFERHRRRQRGWEVRPRGPADYGLFAARPLTAGERLMAFEAEPHRLVTRSHVEREWPARQSEWFRRYAWPLTDEIWAIWGSDPEDWRPVNHSCDPNAWFEGLDVTARTDIAAGEEITLDYATFYNELMPSFECRCGTSSCRGIIRGDDYRRGFVDRYGEHVSDYVRSRRNGGSGG